ncbi:MAG: YidC/Oxa1 family membrane protein insertase [Candidatus Baltobacteraceae bacterium]
MEFPSVQLLAVFNPLAPIVVALHGLLSAINGLVRNFGWSLVILAFLVKLVFWPLNTMQFKGMLKMQELSPKLKALQARFKNDKEKLNAETMALYKESGTNPLAGCLPMLLQMPILISLYWAVISDKSLFASSTWLWIGSGLSESAPFHILAANLAMPDYVLLGLYVVSMYFSVRFTSPPSPDPAQAQQQKIMAFISPAMIGYLGYRYHWPSALILYWLSYNFFTMAQQFYLIEKYHRNPSAVGPHPEAAVEAAGAAKTAIGSGSKNGAPAAKKNEGQAGGSGSGSRSARKRRSGR